jgi:hypothetical protein
MAGKKGRSGRASTSTKPKPGGKADGRIKGNKAKGK